MKRQLTEEEQKHTRRGMERLNEELAYLQYKQEYCDLLLSKGLKLNYLKQLNEKKVEKRNVAEEIQQLQQALIVMQTQLKEGVEVKEAEGEDDGR